MAVGSLSSRQAWSTDPTFKTTMATQSTLHQKNKQHKGRKKMTGNAAQEPRMQVAADSTSNSLSEVDMLTCMTVTPLPKQTQ